ncbi:hypothetical protein [Pedobacter sp. Hv1]|uniref:hypothetical protein n=1 Tax=Pedobacter sp. Hv1 TaxID=1740090 RepID=UPI0006D89295|nr:hypothetical protein [Pedobacter sp. Hv1]KQB99704.1 hypothetical protein AQF98_14330 [Pedobacter sp. Hv1]
MKLSEHKDLKIEILALPPKEKDKLLLRLVAKDKVLTEHLHFLLLEDESNLRDRIANIKGEILLTMQKLEESKNLNAKDVLTALRRLAKLVNHNLRVTKANFEDVELRIFLFNNTITQFKSRVFSSVKNYEQVFATYFIKSTLVTLRKFDKLHEDLQFDLQEGLNRLLKTIDKGNMADVAKDLGLPEQI